jgi:orotidine-5'-phosphate decarboxylase|tara:strand:- start:6893 stop:7690 length:798 start_codon:yes stop_codon:yes gene_type:complete
MISFNKKIKNRANKINSYLCVGIDVDPKLVGSSEFKDLVSHSKKIVDATRDLALCYKPNFAFFERWGSKGFKWLEDIVDYIGDESIIIADAKRGDIGNTAKQYAESIFNHFGFDSVTLSPYMGEDSIMPFLDFEEKGVFILCRTSNPSAHTFQTQNLIDGEYLYESVAKWANSLNFKENIGLVVGATAPQELSKVRKLAPDLPILIPGVGTQGGDLNNCVYESNKTGIGIINVSRDISFSGDCSEKSIRESATSYVDKINKALNG